MYLASGGCAEAPLPERQLRSDDCLRGLELDRLQDQIKRCNSVVATFANQPGPLSDRSLLHILAGDEEAACRDSDKASGLVARLPAQADISDLRRELELRRAICGAPRRVNAAPTSGPSDRAP